MKSPSWAKAQEWSATRWGLRSRTRRGCPWFFQGYAVCGAFSLGHDRLRDDVVGVLDVPLFTAGAFFEPTLGRLGALLLKLGAQGKLTFAVPVQAAPGGLVAGGSSGDAAMPRSTPMKPSGSYASASGTSQVAIR